MTIRTVARAGAGLLVGVTVLVALIWIVAATGLGMSRVVPAALGWAAPEGWTVEVGRVEGAWHSRVRLHDLRLEGPRASASIQDVLVDYRLLPLLSRGIVLERVHVARPRVRAHLAAADPAADEAEAADALHGLARLLSESLLGSWTLDVRELEVREAEATLRRVDGTYLVSDARLRGSATLSPSGVRLHVEPLVAEVTPPEPPDSLGRRGAGSGRLTLVTRLEDALLDVRTLSFVSPRSHVTGAGTLLLAAVPGLVDSVDFELTADPIDLRDLPVRVPEPWAEEPRTTLRVTARGAADSLVFHARADGPGRTALEARAILRTPADTLLPDTLLEERGARAPALEVTADVRGDLSPWSLGPLNGEVSGELELRLDRLTSRTAATLAAALVHRVSADTVGGLVGRDLRMDIALTREAAKPEDLASEAAPEAGPFEAAVTVHTATLRPDDWREVGSVRARGTQRRADWQVDFELGAGSLSGRGGATRETERIEIVVDRFALRDFDASALASDLPATDLTALLEARVAGAALDALSGVVSLRVSPSTFAGTAVESAALRARLEPGVVSGALMAEASGGAVSTDFEVTLGDSVVSARLSQIRAQMRAQTRAQVPAQMSAATTADTAAADAPADRPRLELRGNATGAWWLTEARRATLSVSLDSAVLGGLSMSDGSVEARLVGDSVTAQAGLRVQDVLAAPATVEASLRARGSTLADAVGSMNLSAVRAATADAAAAAADTLALTVRADEPGRFLLDGRLRPAEGGRIDFGGVARVFGDSVSFDVAAAGGIDTPAGLLGHAAIDTLRLEAVGARHAGGWEALHADLLVQGVEWRGVTADRMRVLMSADSSALRLDTLQVQSEVLALDGGGTLPQGGTSSGRLDFRASVQLEPLREVVEPELPRIGANAIVATITGTTDSLEVTTRMEVAALSFDRVEIADARAEAWALVRPPFTERFGLTTGAVDLELDAIALPDTDVQNLTASLSGTPDELRLVMSARVDGERTGELEASIDPRPDGRTAELERFELQLDEDRWALTQPAAVSYVDGFALRGFHLVAGDQAILIDGGVTGAGALDLSLQMDSTDVGTVTDLLGFPRLDGWTGGTVELDGTVDAPSGTADLRMGFQVQGRPPTRADVRLRSDGLEMLTDFQLRDSEGGTLSLDGTMPLPALRRDTLATAAPAAGTAHLDLRVSASAFAVSSAAAFVDADLLATLDGRVDADLTVAGTLEAPRFDGPLELRDGRAELPELGVTWESLRIHARGDGDRLVVDSARAEAGPGYVTLAGTIGMGGTIALDLGAYLRDFQAIRNEQYRAVVSGSLHLGGTPTEPVVEGDVQVESLDVFVGGTTATSVTDVELGEEDLETLRERFGYVPASPDDDRPLSELLTADLTVTLSRDSWLRKRAAPDMAVAFSGDVEVQLRPGAEPRLQGTVTTIAGRGYIQQFGKRFEPREGTVTLAGPADSARVDLSATYTIPSYSTPNNAEATIVLSVQGTRDSLSLTLSSDPPMENADIVSYVATGRPAASNMSLGEGGADQGGQGSQGGIAEAGAGIALNQIVGAVERAAQEGVGLDVVEIRREGIRGATLVAGKYLSPRLYVGFSQPVTRQESDGLSIGNEGQSEVEIEYQALRALLLNIEGTQSSLRIFLRGRLAY